MRTGSAYPTMPNLECVYFIQQGEDGPVKIGFSSNFKKRLASLRSSKITIRLLGVLMGGRGEEYALHERFGQHRIVGEWLHAVRELVELATSLPKELPPV